MIVLDATRMPLKVGDVVDVVDRHGNEWRGWQVVGFLGERPSTMPGRSGMMEMLTKIAPTADSRTWSGERKQFFAARMKVRSL